MTIVKNRFCGSKISRLICSCMQAAAPFVLHDLALHVAVLLSMILCRSLTSQARGLLVVKLGTHADILQGLRRETSRSCCAGDRGRLHQCKVGVVGSKPLLVQQIRTRSCKPCMENWLVKGLGLRGLGNSRMKCPVVYFHGFVICKGLFLIERRAVD